MVVGGGGTGGHACAYRPPRVFTLGVARDSTSDRLPPTVVPFYIFLRQGGACGSGPWRDQALGRLEGRRPLSVLHPQARPLMRVSPGGVFPVHASANPTRS